MIAMWLFEGDPAVVFFRVTTATMAAISLLLGLAVLLVR